MKFWIGAFFVGLAALASIVALAEGDVCGGMSSGLAALVGAWFVRKWWKPNPRKEARAWARALLSEPERRAIVQVETTGIGPGNEVVQIAAIDLAGNVLFDTLVRPMMLTMPADAERRHGITMEMLQSAPRWPEIAHLLEALSGRTLIAYNAEFVAGTIRQTAIYTGGRDLSGPWQCAMLAYAQYVGEKHPKTGAYKWQKMPGAQRTALPNCRAVLALLRVMAEGGKP